MYTLNCLNRIPENPLELIASQILLTTAIIVCAYNHVIDLPLYAFTTIKLLRKLIYYHNLLSLNINVNSLILHFIACSNKYLRITFSPEKCYTPVMTSHARRYICGMYHKLPLL